MTPDAYAQLICFVSVLLVLCRGALPAVEVG